MRADLLALVADDGHDPLWLDRLDRVEPGGVETGHAGAEGVEDHFTLEALQECGVDFVQGYYFGRPMESEDMERLLGEELTPANTAATTD